MAKTTKKTTRARKLAVEKPAAGAKTKAPREDLCVFAFRLTEHERNDIHKAAGPGKASKFARNLLVAAARKDDAAVRAIMKEVQTEA
jgi:hypothetical protein